MNRTAKIGLGLALLAFTIRVALIPTSALKLNPYAVSDAPGMINTAQAVADGLLADGINWPRESPTYRLWGSLLSPFWFLPGPSAVYARIGIAVFGTLIVYNVFCIVRKYAGLQAALIAALPFVVYPSLVLIGATVRRETMVVFGITTVARLAVARSPRLPRTTAAGFAAPIALLTIALRPDNLPVYLLATSAGGVVYAYDAGYSRLARTATVGGVVGGIAAFPLGVAHSGIQYLADIRAARAVGRAAYLPEAVPRSLIDAAGFTPIGAAFFLFAPFPWQFETAADCVAGVEGVLNIGFAVAAVPGFRVLFHRSRPVAVGLAVFLLSGSMFYGLAEGNVGAVVRHRQSFIWVLFVFGAIGLSSKVKFKVWVFGGRC